MGNYRTADIALLRDLDTPEHTERPPGFDQRAADASFRAMAHALAAALGVSALDLEGMESIQDAGFHGEIRLPDAVLNPGAAGPALISVSNFGRLAAVRPEVQIRSERLRAIREVFTAHGYVYVPGALQDGPYDG